MTDQHQDSERRLVAAAKELLDEQLTRLDQPIVDRLSRARREAAQARRKPARLLWVGGLAAACVGLLAVSLWIWQPAVPQPVPDPEDLEILASAEDLDLYEDLDFYSWLADADVRT